MRAQIDCVIPPAVDSFEVGRSNRGNVRDADERTCLEISQAACRTGSGVASGGSEWVLNMRWPRSLAGGLWRWRREGCVSWGGAGCANFWRAAGPRRTHAGSLMIAWWTRATSWLWLVSTL